MKGNRFLSILSAAIILAMLLVAMPAIPGLAITGDESVSLDPNSGAIDDDIDIEGTDFEEDDTVYFYFSSESASVGEYIDTDVENYEVVLDTDSDSSGEISDFFTVPDTLTDGDTDEDVEDGTYYVYAVYYGDDEIVARDTITIISNEISLSPTKGKVGTEVRVTGSGFEGS